MKRKITGSLLFFVHLLFACHSGGQVQKDYVIHFKTGTYFPPQNVLDVVRSPKLLSASRFNGHYYAVIQFFRLPDSLVRITLDKSGIRLLHYLPQSAYLAAIPVDGDITVLKEVKARSLFVLTPQQKMTPELQKRKFPSWAVAQKDYATLVISTVESFDFSLVAKSIASLQGQVIHRQPQFANLTVQIPQKNLIALAQLPFVFSIEPVEEPAKLETLEERQP